MGTWERRWFMVLNAWMRTLLRSPLHRLRSGRVVLLEFRGRRTGRQFRMPVSYWQTGGRVVCLSSATWAKWWRNLEGADVGLWLRGDHLQGRATLVGDPGRRRELVAGFLSHNAHDAHHYGVDTDASDAPLAAGLEALADDADTKVIEITLVS
jgi:hypothetical protein